MRKRHTDDRDIVVRAITAAARELGAESPMFPLAVTWFLDHVPELVGLFGEESQMFWDIQYRQPPRTSKATHINTVMKQYGYRPRDFDAVSQRFNRWKRKCKAIFHPTSKMGEVLWSCLKHLYPPPSHPSGETETFYV